MARKGKLVKRKSGENGQNRAKKKKILLENNDRDWLEDDTTSTETSDDFDILEKENRVEEVEGGGITGQEGVEIQVIADDVGKSVSALTVSNIAYNGRLTVEQKSQIANWAEQHFLRSNKIMTVEQAAKNMKLRMGICTAIGIKHSEWTIVGSEVIKKLRSIMSDRVSLHRKTVKTLYMGKTSLHYVCHNLT